MGKNRPSSGPALRSRTRSRLPPPLLQRTSPIGRKPSSSWWYRDSPVLSSPQGGRCVRLCVVPWTPALQAGPVLILRLQLHPPSRSRPVGRGGSDLSCMFWRFLIMARLVVKAISKCSVPPCKVPPRGYPPKVGPSRSYPATPPWTLGRKVGSHPTCVPTGTRNWDLAGPKPESDSWFLIPAGVPEFGYSGY